MTVTTVNISFCLVGPSLMDQLNKQGIPFDVGDVSAIENRAKSAMEFYIDRFITRRQKDKILTFCADQVRESVGGFRSREVK